MGIALAFCFVFVFFHLLHPSVYKFPHECWMNSHKYSKRPSNPKSMQRIIQNSLLPFVSTYDDQDASHDLQNFRDCRWIISHITYNINMHLLEICINLQCDLFNIFQSCFLLLLKSIVKKSVVMLNSWRPSCDIFIHNYMHILRY